MYLLKSFLDSSRENSSLCSARRSSKILCDPYAATERSSGREAHAAGKVPVNEFADLLSFLREKSFIENLAKVESMR